MKFRIILAGAVLACACWTMPALAQAPAPEAEAVLQQYIANHPEVKRNPSLLSNPAYLNSHPDIAHFIQTHPAVLRQIGRMGAYDSNHQWRDEDWWHKNDPNWIYQNHPNWNNEHPQWMNDGDYDDQHQWRNRQWWAQNHPNWVKQHHPNWDTADNNHNENHGPGPHSPGPAHYPNNGPNNGNHPGGGPNNPPYWNANNPGHNPPPPNPNGPSPGPHNGHGPNGNNWNGHNNNS